VDNRIDETCLMLFHLEMSQIDSKVTCQYVIIFFDDFIHYICFCKIINEFFLELKSSYGLGNYSILGKQGHVIVVIFKSFPMI
jgi:hypothetical protein